MGAEQLAAPTAMAAGRDVHRYKGETMSHQGGNTLRTALIAEQRQQRSVRDATTSRSMYVRAEPLTSRGQSCRYSAYVHEYRCESQSGSMVGQEHCARMTM
jgi:hypothetical protein